MSRETIVLGPDRDGRRSVFQEGRLVWEGASPPPRSLTERPGESLTMLPCPEQRIGHGHVNAHTHLYSGLMPYGVSLPRPWPASLAGILEALWWRLDRALDEQLLAIAARVSIGEALLAGTTTLIDHHESPRFIAGSLGVLSDELERVGARGIVTYGASERNFGRKEAREGLDECERTIRRLRSERVAHRVAGLVGLHAGFTVSDETIREAAILADILNVGLHLHAAESEDDGADARRRGFAGLAQRLDANLALGPRTILAHGVHLSPAEVALANQRGAWFVQNARSNKVNGVGYPVALVDGRQVALGTDGFPSCMRDEVMAAQAEGASHGEAPGDFEARLHGGLELASRLLSSEVREDRVAMGPGGAWHVVVAGRVVVREGRLTRIDYGSAQDEARRAASLLNERMRTLE